MTDPTPTPPSRRRLTKSSDEKMIFGVAGGLAEHFNTDPTLIRIAFVILTLFGGGGLLAYIVMAVVIPGDTA